MKSIWIACLSFITLVSHAQDDTKRIHQNFRANGAYGLSERNFSPADSTYLAGLKSGAITSGANTSVSGLTKSIADGLYKPSSYVPSWSELTNKPTLFSGNYSDLANKPALFSGSYSDLANKPVLFSGNYNDLMNKPAPQAVPTVVSALGNDAGFQNAVQVNTAINQALSVFIVAGKQLYNYNTATAGFYIDNAGALTANSGFYVSDYIKLDPNSYYTTSAGGNSATPGSENKQFFTLYDANKQVITSTIGMFNRTTTQFQTTSATAYARFTIPNSALNTFQVEKVASISSPPTALEAYSAGGVQVGRPLAGKRILWLGTSIPKLGGFPEIASAQVGAVCINNAVASSPARKAKSNGSIANLGYPGVMWSLSRTSAEAQAQIDSWPTAIRDSLNPGFGGPESTALSAADRAKILGTSYEVLLSPYLSGTALVDLIIFEHDFNDGYDTGETDGQFATVPANPYDRNTYIGAINYLIRHIQTVNPRMPIAFVGHYENQLYPKYAAANQTLANYWGFPILKLWEKTGFSQVRIPGTALLWGSNGYSGTRGIDAPGLDMTRLRYAIPDGVHPNTDSSGKTQSLLGQIIAKFLATLL